MYWLWWRNVLRMLIVNCSFINVNIWFIVVSYFRSPPCPWSSTCTQKYPGPVRVRPDTQTATDQYFQSSLARFTEGVNSALSLSYSLCDLIKIRHNERWWRTRSGKLCTVTDWSPVLSWNRELVLRLLSRQRQGSPNQVHPAEREPTTFSLSLFGPFHSSQSILYWERRVCCLSGGCWGLRGSWPRPPAPAWPGGTSCLSTGSRDDQRQLRQSKPADRVLTASTVCQCRRL